VKSANSGVAFVPRTTQTQFLDDLIEYQMGWKDKAAARQSLQG
jgi:hypothetical protein